MSSVVEGSTWGELAGAQAGHLQRRRVPRARQQIADHVVVHLEIWKQSRNYGAEATAWEETVARLTRADKAPLNNKWTVKCM